MPKQFSISLDDFNYAAEQMQLPLKNRFGDLDWERRLAAQNNELYRNAIRVSGAALLDAPALTNYALRRAMTCVFASIYHAMGRQLPRMTLGQWREIQFAFAKPRVAEPYTSLLVRVEELIKSINPWLAHTWVQAMERDVRRATHATDEQMAFVSALVLLLVANLLEEPYFRLLPDKPADKPGTTPKPDEKKIQQQVTIGDSGLTSVASEVTFDDIGGCRQSKDELRKLVQRMTTEESIRGDGGNETSVGHNSTG